MDKIGALLRNIKSENIITDISNMYFAEFIMYVKEGEEFISFEFIKTEIKGTGKQTFVLVCYKGDENNITELSTFNNSAVEELEEKIIDNPFNWLSKVIEFAENYNTVVGIIKI